VLTDRLFKTASFRLSVLYGAIFVICFVILLFITYWTATAALRDQIRTKITEDIQALATEAATDGTHSVIQDIEERLKFAGSAIGYYFLNDKQGGKLAGNLDRIKTQDGWQEAPLSDFIAAKSGDQLDEDHELWGQGIRLPDGAFLFVGQDAFRVLSVQEAIIESFAWSAGIAFFLAAFAGVAVSQGFLRRIDAINTTSLAIIDGRLKERIPVRGTADEIDRLSMNLNRLFDSNQALLESLRQVSTSIAHDLRTPLSRLRQGLEEARQKTGNAKAYEGVIESAISEADQLLATFSALLRIAQIESGTRKAGFKTVDLTGVYERVANAYRPVAEDQGKELFVSLAPEIVYQGDAELLLQMIANLLENAIRHTPPQTRIELTLARDSSGITAVIADSGPGIPPELREKVFERFFRLDASRATEGNGLGLALVHAVAVLHGIKISLQDNRPGLKVILGFPPLR
jgi:signal transduction histidine kinase